MVFFAFIASPFYFLEGSYDRQKIRTATDRIRCHRRPCPGLPGDLSAEALAKAEGRGRVTVTLDMNAHLLAWLKIQQTDWQREINNTMRFFMETSAAPASPRKPYGRKTDLFPF
jgi:hypothetical protein